MRRGYSCPILVGTLATVIGFATSAGAAGVACGVVQADDADVKAAWVALENECPCEVGQGPDWRKERSAFLACARSFAKDAAARGDIRRECRRDLLKAAKRSTCSRPETAVTCCKTTPRGSKSCSIYTRAEKCAPNSLRFAEVGETATCLDACDNLAGPACLTDAECQDGDPCTIDTCDPTNGCSNTPDPSCGSGGGSGGTSCSGTGSSTHGLSSQEQLLAQLINDYRKGSKLATCTSLNRAAQDHANDMRDRKYFSHTSKDGSRFWERACDAGYQQGCGPTTWMGEIIARTPWDSTAPYVFNLWKNSPGHDAQMTKESFAVMGIGYACGGALGDYWVVDFAAHDEPSCH